VIGDYWEGAEFPLDLARRLGELGLSGDGIEGYGCPPMSPVAVGLVNMELNRGDGSLGTFAGVQGGLAMRSIAMHGSDSVALETSARRDGDAWVLNGEKRWIGNGTIADVVVVWARDADDGQVKAFLVETDTPGCEARKIDGKASVRAVWQADIELRDVRVSGGDRLPGAKGFKDAGRVLASTRQACAWMALGHAVSAYDSALTYARQREQFGKPLVSFQIVQERLAKMLAEVTAMQLYCLQLGRLVEQNKLRDTIAGLAKMNDTIKARQVIAEGRNLLGGNGILLDYHVIRHMADIEAIYTFEGTETIQALIVGRDVTGVSAFA
jgi:glutaryl-CoA dehydrogenase